MKNHDENWLTAGIGMALTLIVLIPIILIAAVFAKQIVIGFLIIIALAATASIIYDFIDDGEG